MALRIGDRIRFQSTATHWRTGTVADATGPTMIGVVFDDARNAECTYIDKQFLHPATPAGRAQRRGGTYRIADTRTVTVAAVKRAGKAASGNQVYRVYVRGGKVWTTTADSPAGLLLDARMSTLTFPCRMTLAILERGTVADIRLPGTG